MARRGRHRRTGKAGALAGLRWRRSRRPGWPGSTTRAEGRRGADHRHPHLRSGVWRDEVAPDGLDRGGQRTAAEALGFYPWIDFRARDTRIVRSTQLHGAGKRGPGVATHSRSWAGRRGRCVLRRRTDLPQNDLLPRIRLQERLVFLSTTPGPTRGVETSESTASSTCCGRRHDGLRAESEGSLATTQEVSNRTTQRNEGWGSRENRERGLTC